MSRLVTLYPRAWRDRYEDEFVALIAERPPTFADRLDAVRGALDAHLHPQLPGAIHERDRMGVGPLLGFGLLYVAVLIMANGPIHHDEYGMYRDGALAAPFLLGSLLLLSFGLHRVVDRLPVEAAIPRASGWVAIIAGPTWALMPWVAPLGVAFLIGVLGLTVGARRAGVWPAWSEVVLVVSLAAPAGLLLAIPFLPWYAFRVSGLDFSVVIIPMSSMWLVVGGLVLRGRPRPALG